MVILQAYYCTVKWLTLLFLFSRSQVWYLGQHSWHARAWTKPKIKDQWAIWNSSEHIWQFCHIPFHLCLFTSFASSSCGLLLLQRQFTSLISTPSWHTAWFFGEILQIETVYSNFRKGPLDLLQILATELHVVDYLKNWAYFHCSLNTYCHLHYL